MSLRDARERLHGPLARAVEECSKNLLESVEEFTATFARSPHDHVEREGGGNRRENAEVGYVFCDTRVVEIPVHGDGLGFCIVWQGVADVPGWTRSFEAVVWMESMGMRPPTRSR